MRSSFLTIKILTITSQNSEESGDENDENVHTTQKRRRIINYDDSDSDEGNLN